eukprot:TRINITY_DN14532_c0_g2_i2.p1 TRINITY_DN14532_c0_g2~~TRINITY_DN14532_c0_g2_i2.p1  ORF type:complete len:395 (+),score=63.91 TRINITY_DN14532_c0_g2_i2:96-1280(+)
MAGVPQQAGGGAAAEEGAAQERKRLGDPIAALAGSLLRVDLSGGSGPPPKRPRPESASASTEHAALLAAVAAAAGAVVSRERKRCQQSEPDAETALCHAFAETVRLCTPEAKRRCLDSASCVSAAADGSPCPAQCPCRRRSLPADISSEVFRFASANGSAAQGRLAFRTPALAAAAAAAGGGGRGMWLLMCASHALAGRGAAADAGAGGPSRHPAPQGSGICQSCARFASTLQPAGISRGCCAECAANTEDAQRLRSALIRQRRRCSGDTCASPRGTAPAPYSGPPGSSARGPARCHGHGVPVSPAAVLQMIRGSPPPAVRAAHQIHGPPRPPAPPRCPPPLGAHPRPSPLGCGGYLPPRSTADGGGVVADSKRFRHSAQELEGSYRNPWEMEE